MRMHDRTSARRSAALRYAATWVGGGVIVALALIVLIRLIGGPTEGVNVPPVREPSLETAARHASCRLLGPRDERPPEPPSHGFWTSPARPGIYGTAPPRQNIVAALRRGVVVIQYRPDVGTAEADSVRRLFDAVPEGTIVAENERLTLPIAAAAWRRAIICPRITSSATDAVRLFRGRFLGRGPDS